MCEGGERVVNIVIVLPKIEDARGIRSILAKNGIAVSAVCATGAQALNHLRDLNDGIVICGYKMTDMIYLELRDCMPPGFDLLLLASKAVLNDCLDNDIMCLAMPLKVHDLINTVDLMCQAILRRRRKARLKPKERDPKEEALIQEAKEVLMIRNNMTEQEAYRYIQKCSMDSSTNMVETAQMILTLMHG